MNQFIAFSGGKDSTALALMMPDATPVFTDTGWEFDELYAHIDKFERVTGREVIRIQSKHGALPDYIRKSKFMPGFASRFCTRMFKIEPYNEFINAHLPATLNIGLRADESDRTGNTSEIEGLTIRYPLREWGMTVYDVIQLCADYDLLPRYPPYMARGGCKGCFYKRSSEVVAIAHLQPDVLKELADLEQDVQDERGKFAVLFSNIGKPVTQIQREVAMQPTLFDIDQIYASASQRDDMGAACGLFCNR